MLDKGLTDIADAFIAEFKAAHTKMKKQVEELAAKVEANGEPPEHLVDACLTAFGKRLEAASKELQE